MQKWRWSLDQTILIVDDSPHIRKQLEFYLKSEGYLNIFFAESASDARKQLGLDESEKAGGGIDLIMMDINMPEISGIEACRRIKATKNLRDIPIIMVTASTEIKDLQKSFEAGAIDYTAKPLKKVEILARVRSALRLKCEMDRCKAHKRELEKVNKELKYALQEIKILSGFVIQKCSLCKKICNEQGHWQQENEYEQETSDDKFTYSICPDCAGGETSS